jgi:hypothetical protein
MAATGVGRAVHRGPRPFTGKGCAMDQTFLLALLAALVVALVALARITTRTRPSTGEAAAESSFGVSTEGMKICPTCGMGNLWTERSCSGCGSALKG